MTRSRRIVDLAAASLVCRVALAAVSPTETYLQSSQAQALADRLPRP